MDLFSEIGPPADLSVEMLLNLSQPPGLRVGTLNENRTPFSVTVSLDAHINDATGAHAAATRESEATPTLTAVGEEPGCAVAEADAEGPSRVMPTTATITAVAAIASLAALFMLANLRIVLLLCRVAHELLAQTMRCACFRSVSKRATAVSVSRGRPVRWSSGSWDRSQST
jgi:hypothetical protein